MRSEKASFRQLQELATSGPGQTDHFFRENNTYLVVGENFAHQVEQIKKNKGGGNGKNGKQSCKKALAKNVENKKIEKSKACRSAELIKLPNVLELSFSRRKRGDSRCVCVCVCVCLCLCLCLCRCLCLSVTHIAACGRTGSEFYNIYIYIYI